MARPYSLDLRVRVVAAVEEGQSCRSVAEAFGLSNSCVVKWTQRVRSTGSVAPGKMGGHRRQLLAGHRDFILARLAAEPHLALRSLQVELIERGVAVSYGALWNFVHRLGQSFRKKRSANGARPAGRRTPPSTLEEASGAD